MSNTDMIRVVLVVRGEPAKVVQIPNTLEAKQELVGGSISCPSLDDSMPEGHPLTDAFKNLDIVAQDDTNDPLSWQFSEESGVFGTFFVARANPVTGDYVDLHDEDIKNLLSYFNS